MEFYSFETIPIVSNEEQLKYINKIEISVYEAFCLFTIILIVFVIITIHKGYVENVIN